VERTFSAQGTGGAGQVPVSRDEAEAAIANASGRPLPTATGFRGGAFFLIIWI
jgi:hypothetical protein